MNELTAEWVTKADEDYSVATGLIRRRKFPPTRFASIASKRRKNTSKLCFKIA